MRSASGRLIQPVKLPRVWDRLGRCWPSDITAAFGFVLPNGIIPRGNRKARKHGLYTREAIAQRRQLGELMRQSQTDPGD
jgi:hypothetical protein